MWCRALAVGALASVALALAGCQQRESSSQYRHRLRGVEQQVTSIQDKLPDAKVDDVDYYDSSAKDLRALADGLEEVGPPSEVDDAQKLYVKALRGLSRLMGDLADCARLEQARKGSGANCRRGVDQSAIDQVTNDLRQAQVMYRDSGYK